jgi:acetolactate synthase I/III small subunit
MTERVCFSVVLEDQPGVVGRVGTFLAGMGVNIGSIVVARTEDPGLARMTVLAEPSAGERVTVGELETIEGVVSASELPPGAAFERELAIFRVHVSGDLPSRVIEVASVFRARLADVSPGSVTIEAVGIPEEIDALEELLAEFGQLEMVRTGPVRHARGEPR